MAKQSINKKNYYLRQFPTQKSFKFQPERGTRDIAPLLSVAEPPKEAFLITIFTKIRAGGLRSLTGGGIRFLPQRPDMIIRLGRQEAVDGGVPIEGAGKASRVWGAFGPVVQPTGM